MANLVTHRTGLIDGEQCPLCGAEAHPWAHDEARAQADATIAETVMAAEAALAEVADVNLNDGSDSSSAKKDDSVPLRELPETALRLPGVSEKEQPRFRRQMYRTDI